MNVYHAVLMTAFGKNSAHPKRTATLKLTSLLVGSLLMGTLLSRSAPPLPAQGMRALIVWGPSVMFAVQMLTLFVLLSAQRAILSPGDKTCSLLAILPLSHRQWTLTLLLPSLSLTLVSLLFALPLLLTMVVPTGLNPTVVLLCMVIGAWSAFALMYPPPFLRNPLLHGVCVLLGVWGEYRLIAAAHTGSDLAAEVLFGAVAVLCVAATYSSEWFLRHMQQPGQPERIRATRLSPRWWAVKAILRNKGVAIGVSVACSINTVLLLVMYRQQSIDWDLVGTVGALLAASVAADVRGLFRRSKPPEIVSLRGTRRFVSATIIPGSIGSIATALPLVIGAVCLNPSQMAIVLPPVIAGSFAGILAGVTLVPSPRDISAQAAASLLCCVFVLLPGQLPWMRGNVAGIATGYLCLGAVCAASAYAIEYKRNSYMWRKYDH